MVNSKIANVAVENKFKYETKNNYDNSYTFFEFS